nr:hypothetical protein [Tanacetum cinerariifolium]
MAHSPAEMCTPLQNVMQAWILSCPMRRLLSIPTTLRLRKEHWKTCSFRLETERTIVKIDDTRSQKEWNFPSCDGEKCKKGVVRKNGRFWCQVCKKAIYYPVLRFQLELYISDKTASTIMVMFDEPEKELLKCFADSLAAADDESGFGYADHAGLPLALAKIIGTTYTLEMKSHTYYEHGSYQLVSRAMPTFRGSNELGVVAYGVVAWTQRGVPTVTNIAVTNEDVGSSKGSYHMNTSTEVNITKVKRLATKPFVTTPSKPTKEKELKDSNDESTGDMDDGRVDGKKSSLTDKRKKKRYIVDDCDSA